jgi:tetratricopeptide (TPR) repeat protein
MNRPHEHEPDQETASHYVSGALTEAEQAEFEAHFFECPRCLAEVQALQAARDVLASRGDRGAATPPHRPRQGSSFIWALAAAASLGFALVAWTVLSQRGATDTGTVATRTPPTPATAPPAASSTPPSVAPTPPASTPSSARPGETATPALLRELALVVAPPFARLATRGEQPPTTDTLADAMTQYAAGRYDLAADKLRDVIRDARDTAAATQGRFFLGVCALKLERYAEAQAALEQTAASDTPPYADEAHFYLAKAAIATGDLDRARRELRIAIDREAGPEGEAARMLERLERVSR